MQADHNEMKEIKVGDWVESAYVKDYFKILDINEVIVMERI